MRFERTSGTALLVTLFILAMATGCGAGQEETVQEAAVPSPHGSIPASEEGELPEGHPPIEPGQGSLTIKPVPSESGTGASGLTWRDPEGWTAETPSSSMRRAQYRVGGEGGDAQCVVYYFGPGEGGGAMANVQRWGDQFTQPDGRPSREVLKIEEIEVNGIQVTLAEITGTYMGGMAMGGQPPETLEDYMLLGAVAVGPDANWFFKFTGPQATVAEQRGAFRAMIESLQAGD
jgi:hypothetical protein